MTTKQLLEGLFDLPDGHSYVIPCESEAQQRSLKQRFWREIKRSGLERILRCNIVISLREINGKPCVVLIKQASLEAYVQTPDGQLKPASDFVVSSTRREELLSALRDVQKGFVSPEDFEEGLGPFTEPELKLLERHGFQRKPK